MDKKELKITNDGSHTLFVPDMDETYHSTHGAIQEAKHVFIEAGFKYLEKKELNILEVGFGTGLNAFLTLLESENNAVKVNYTSLEAFPLTLEIIHQLNYVHQLDLSENKVELYYDLHRIEWGSYQKVNTHFKLQKLEEKLEEYIASSEFDIIYFDAFGPRVQPEMWTIPIFQKMYECLKKDGVLVTYCAKGAVKRGLKEVGFVVETLPGPPGKREMTRGIKL